MAAPQHALQRGQGVARRIRPLGPPLGPPCRGPGFGLRRVEDGHHEPVGLQLGHRHPGGRQRHPQGGDHHPADVPDGRGAGQRGGQPLHDGDLVRAGAQIGGVGNHSQHALRGAVGVDQYPAAQAQPAQFAVGPADADRQLLAGGGQSARLDERHQRGNVVRCGALQQRLHPPVELLGSDAEQLHHLGVRVDPSGAQRQRERAAPEGVQPRPQQRPPLRPRHGAGRDGLQSRGHLVGVQLQQMAAVDVEGVRRLVHDHQASQPFGVPAQRQYTHRDVGRQRPGTVPGLRTRTARGTGDAVLRQLRRAQPQREAGAEGGGNRRVAGQREARRQAVGSAGAADHLGQLKFAASCGRHIDGGQLSPGGPRDSCGHCLHRLRMPEAVVVSHGRRVRPRGPERPPRHRLTGYVVIHGLLSMVRHAGRRERVGERITVCDQGRPPRPRLGRIVPEGRRGTDQRVTGRMDWACRNTLRGSQ